MHVKKVEIFGFKSFGFKNTTVQFEPGLVSISGPNGSGKSNILDAIIFAMGENKPKVMRVDKLRSLIHDIEGTRRGPKMARSSVHFDNSDRKIPVDSDVVEITRELDESGDNTYYLNKKKTQRSHVLDLLDMANAGLGQLNAVQQGTVTRISEFTSEEKRKTIEDLIGLSYFDEKKSESIKQLDEADRRLEIALAKMGEIKKRIDELEEERNQKLRHDILERELNRYKAIAAANKMKIISSKKSTDKYSKPIVDLSIATILSINSSGVGERVCIDLIERLKIGEGMVIGSNSSSLALVHGETIESEYVPSRPFRVNAGSIHSYVLMSDGSTKYLSELSAGDEVSVISHSGVFRKSIIGRLKIERRPFLIIRFRSMSGNEGQIMLQQAETVRLVNASGSIISVTNLEIGDEIIVRNDNQMRHIGNALDGEMREK